MIDKAAAWRSASYAALLVHSGIWTLTVKTVASVRGCCVKVRPLDLQSRVAEPLGRRLYGPVAAIEEPSGLISGEIDPLDFVITHRINEWLCNSQTTCDSPTCRSCRARSGKRLRERGLARPRLVRLVAQSVSGYHLMQGGQPAHGPGEARGVRLLAWLGSTTRRFGSDRGRCRLRLFDQVCSHAASRAG
jgi:hypothetical protein